MAVRKSILFFAQTQLMSRNITGSSRMVTALKLNQRKPPSTKQVELVHFCLLHRLYK